MYHLVGGDIHAAIDWYERAIEQRQPVAVLLAAAEYMKAARSRPRWPKLTKMMNLAPVDIAATIAAPRGCFVLQPVSSSAASERIVGKPELDDPTYGARRTA